MIDRIIFLVERLDQSPNLLKNVIVEASNREFAKSYSSLILGGDPDLYVVTPITKREDRTIFLLGETR